MADGDSIPLAAEAVTPIVVSGQKKQLWGYGFIEQLAPSSNEENTLRLQEAYEYIAPLDPNGKTVYSGEVWGGSKTGNVPVNVQLFGADQASIGVEAGANISLGIQGTAGDNRFEIDIIDEPAKWATARPHIILDGGAGNDTAVLSTEKLKDATIRQTGEGEYLIQTREADYTLRGIEGLQIEGQQAVTLETLAVAENNEPTKLSAAMKASLEQFAKSAPAMARMECAEGPGCGDAVSPSSAPAAAPSVEQLGR